jgi:hypothetical protein
MTDDATFVPLASPVGGLMKRLAAKRALDHSDALIQKARETDNPAMRRQGMKCLVDYEKLAEESQFWA